MRWSEGRRSDNVEDRRGMGGPVLAGGVGILGIILALVVALLGGDPFVVLQQLGGGGMGMGGAPVSVGRPRQPTPADNKLADFVSVVLADTEDTWTKEFRENGGTYRSPKLVIFDGVANSACGRAAGSTGPFYCPNDQKVYIDLNFYRQLRSQLGAPGDFAQAYVIAHEIGHHVQHLLGIDQKVQGMQRRLPQSQANQLSVRLELQADCFAGVWAHQTQTQRGTRCSARPPVGCGRNPSPMAPRPRGNAGSSRGCAAVTSTPVTPSRPPNSEAMARSVSAGGFVEPLHDQGHQDQGAGQGE